MATLLNGTVVEVLKEVDRKDYHFRSFKVNIMLPGRPGCEGRKKGEYRKPGKPQYMIVSENELTDRVKVGKFPNVKFNGECRNGQWTVTHDTIPTAFVGVGKTFTAAKKDWIRQYEKTA